jgi:hypothetical protein
MRDLRAHEGKQECRLWFIESKGSVILCETTCVSVAGNLLDSEALENLNVSLLQVRQSGSLDLERTISQFSLSAHDKQCRMATIRTIFTAKCNSFIPSVCDTGNVLILCVIEDALKHFVVYGIFYI